jgi:CRP-like cAMP-binding protein
VDRYTTSIQDKPVDKDVSQFVAAVKRVPLFAGLQPTQAVTLLKICERRSLAVGETLCRFGDRSDKMYILLSGELSVRTEDDTQIAKIAPVAPVGEMGLFTDEPRSATLVATEASTLFVLGKYPFENAMRQNKDVEVTVSRNVIATLANRIRQSNEELNHLRSLISDQGAEMEETE